MSPGSATSAIVTAWWRYEVACGLRRRRRCPASGLVSPTRRPAIGPGLAAEGRAAGSGARGGPGLRRAQRGALNSL
jgi:hypothetical protein